MSFILLLLAIVAIYFLGYLFYRIFIGEDPEGLLGVACCWALGSLGISLQLLYYSWLQIPWNLGLITLPWIFLVGVLVFRGVKFPSIYFSRLEFAYLFIILLFTLFFGTYSVSLPLWDWDGWLIWGFKSQLFFYQGHIDFANLAETSLQWTHPEYPLLFPLLQTWVYLVMGAVHTGWGKIIGMLFYLNLGCLFIGLLRNSVKNELAVFIGLLLVILNPLIVEATQMNYADMPLSFYILLAGTAVWLWTRTRKKEWLLISQLAMGAAGWMKQEGIVVWFSLTIATLLFLLVTKNRQMIKVYLHKAWISLAIWLPWLIYAKYHSLSWEKWSDNMNIEFILSSGDQISTIAFYFKNLLESSSFGYTYFIFPLTFLLGILFFPKQFCRRILLLYVLTSLIVILYGTIYIFTPHNILWHLQLSAQRLLLQSFPLIIFTIIVTLAMFMGDNQEDDTGDIT